jgi:hypothetical protein
MKVGLFIKMTPRIVTRDIKKGQIPTVEFRIFNSSNNGTYSCDLPYQYRKRGSDTT